MHKLHAIIISMAAAGLVAFAACGGDDDDTGADATSGSHSAGSELPQGSEPVDLAPTDFTVDIDNSYWPMNPGDRWTYVETDGEGGEQEVVVTVTSATKEIANGITARVVRDTVTEDGEVIEDTFDWYAQDSAGNIWYVGEETAEFEDGEVASTEGAWEAGVDGALPGIIMPAEPQDDMVYRQEYYEGEAEDNGEILSVGATVQVPAGEYTDCVMTKDTSGIEPDVLELKFYGPGVGPVLAIGVSGGGREELVSVETVSAEVADAAGTVALGEGYD